MRKKFTLTALLCFLIFTPIHSQSNYNEIKKERFSRIEYYHFAVGMDAAMHYNYNVSPKIFVGMGSSRNLLNADVGFKYNFRNPLYGGSGECISIQEFQMFASLNLNVIRGKETCLFIGGEVASHWAVNSTHRINISNTEMPDTKVGNDYFSVCAKIGFRLKKWEASLFYEYDLSPSMNQKYVYESAEYDYQSLYNSLFERARMGIGLTYYIPFEP